jgi:amino acid transporter
VGGVIALTVACFIGVETTPAYAEEARHHRALTWASFTAVLGLGILLAASAWAVATVVGPSNIARVTPDVVFSTIDAHVGIAVLWAAQILLVTSILGAMISAHQAVARYVFALGREGVLPASSGRIRVGHGVPVGGSVLQTVTGLAVLSAWTFLHGDPMVLFAWLAALSAVAVMVLMIGTCLAVMRFFRRGGGSRESVWVRVGAPLAGALAVGVLLSVTLSNLSTLVGPTSRDIWLLPALVVAVGVGGAAWGAVLHRRWPGMVLGDGEREPLAEVPHHLYGVPL